MEFIQQYWYLWMLGVPAFLLISLLLLATFTEKSSPWKAVGLLFSWISMYGCILLFVLSVILNIISFAKS